MPPPVLPAGAHACELRGKQSVRVSPGSTESAPMWERPTTVILAVLLVVTWLSHTLSACIICKQSVKETS